jgi:hypothetical protein
LLLPLPTPHFLPFYPENISTFKANKGERERVQYRHPPRKDKKGAEMMLCGLLRKREKEGGRSEGHCLSPISHLFISITYIQQRKDLLICTQPRTILFRGKKFF